MVLAIGAGAAWKSGVFKKEHAVPNLVGLSYSQASSALEGDGFTLSVTTKVNSSTVALNDIVTPVTRRRHDLKVRDHYYGERFQGSSHCADAEQSGG